MSQVGRDTDRIDSAVRRWLDQYDAELAGGRGVGTPLTPEHRLIGSMSRKGNGWDNSVMERFFLNLKMERVWQRDYANALEARADISDYIVNFYNSIRLHSTLKYQSPADCERQAVQATP